MSRKSTCLKSQESGQSANSPAKDADLKAFGEQKGEFVSKNGEKVKSTRPQKISGDILDEIDFEPIDDVPLVLAKNGAQIPKAVCSCRTPRRSLAQTRSKSQQRTRRKPPRWKECLRVNRR
jgi:hypothetical protein